MVVTTRQIFICTGLWLFAFISITLAVCQIMSSEPPAVYAKISPKEIRYKIPSRKPARQKAHVLSDIDKHVEYAAKKADVRAQFLRGIFVAESGMGRNLGSGNWKEELSDPACELHNLAFRFITKRLRLDPDKMPVSKKLPDGPCGGAMGAAQIMPANWVEYHKEVSRITGEGFPNPWKERDSILVASLMLCDLGACAKTPDAERQAALKYRAGALWHKPEYRTYGDKVMRVAHLEE